MTDLRDYEEIWRWHSYPCAIPLQNISGSMADACRQLIQEMAAHNPSMPMTAHHAVERVSMLSYTLGEELRRVNAEACDQRWLYKKLIDQGDCP